MAYLTFNKLRASSYQSAFTMNARSGHYKTASESIFLSYRRQDKVYVVPVVEFLKRNGVNVYIDYLDDSLEDDNTKVAGQLRTRISNCKKFISLVTPNSATSKWMPWELGLGDRIVNYENVAVLPITHNENSWGDQEYGAIYGRIQDQSPYNSNYEDWYIIYPDGNRVSLLNWINI